jgi:hypothetical protein
MFNLYAPTGGLQNRRRGIARLLGGTRAWSLGHIGAVATLASALAGTTGCASSIAIRERIAAPRAASYVDEKLKPTAVLRGEKRRELPDGAKLTSEAVVLARDEIIVLQDRDTVVMDEAGALTQIDTKRGPRVFAPGTARLVGDTVKVSDSAPRVWMKFAPNDVVELRGDYEAGDITPTGGRVDGKRSLGLAILGSLVFAAAYIPSAVIGGTSDVKGDSLLLIPLLGPWLDLAKREACNPNDAAEQTLTPCSTESFNNALLVTSGVTQLIGVGFFAAGIWTRPSYTRDMQPTGLRVVPNIGRTGGSVNLTGAF